MNAQDTYNNPLDQSQEKQPSLNQPEESSQATNPSEPVQSSQTVSETELSTVTTNSTPPKRSFKILIIISIIILIGAGLVIFMTLKPRFQDADTKSGLPTPSPSAYKQPSHYLGSQTVNLNDVSIGTSSGSVTRNITEGLVTHVVQTQLPDPEEGYIYQTWLVRNNEELVRYAILIKNEQGSYTLNTEFKFDPAEPPFTTFETMHNTFIVSKESVNDDLIETRILEGTFTQ